MSKKEIWKDIEGYEGYYQVSNLGRAKGLTRVVGSHHNGSKIIKEKMLKPLINGRGYYQVSLCKYRAVKTIRIHQLVAVAFLNHKINGLTLVVNHKDFNITNNNSDNLEIVTVRENSNRKHIKSSSKFIGVSWSKCANKWVSNIHINGRLKYLGCFIDEYQAHLAYENELKLLKTT